MALVSTVLVMFTGSAANEGTHDAKLQMAPGLNTAADIVHVLGEGAGILNMEDVRVQSYNTVPGLRPQRDKLRGILSAHKLLELNTRAMF
jgi:hypothetical protein